MLNHWRQFTARYGLNRTYAITVCGLAIVNFSLIISGTAKEIPIAYALVVVPTLLVTVTVIQMAVVKRANRSRAPAPADRVPAADGTMRMG